MDKHRKSLRWMLWIPTGIIMIVIFMFSAQPADLSAQTSSPIAKLILHIWELFFGTIPATEWHERLAIADHLVRKAAHMTEYMILSFFVAAPLWKLHHLRGQKFYMGMFLIPVLYACTDEFHQVFVEGRSGSPKDVLIDSIGCLIGCFIFFVICQMGRRRKKRTS